MTDPSLGAQEPPSRKRGFSPVSVVVVAILSATVAVIGWESWREGGFTNPSVPPSSGEVAAPVPQPSPVYSPPTAEQLAVLAVADKVELGGPFGHTDEDEARFLRASGWKREHLADLEEFAGAVATRVQSAALIRTATKFESLAQAAQNLDCTEAEAKAWMEDEKPLRILLETLADMLRDGEFESARDQFYVAYAEHFPAAFTGDAK